MVRDERCNGNGEEDFARFYIQQIFLSLLDILQVGSLLAYGIGHIGGSLKEYQVIFMVRFIHLSCRCSDFSAWCLDSGIDYLIVDIVVSKVYWPPHCRSIANSIVSSHSNYWVDFPFLAYLQYSVAPSAV